MEYEARIIKRMFRSQNEMPMKNLRARTNIISETYDNKGKTLIKMYFLLFKFI